MFPDEATARTYIEKRVGRKEQPARLRRGRADRRRKNGFYRCNACKVDFTFAPEPFSALAYSPAQVDLCDVSPRHRPKGISSLQLGKENRRHSKSRGSFSSASAKPAARTSSWRALSRLTSATSRARREHAIEASRRTRHCRQNSGPRDARARLAGARMPGQSAGPIAPTLRPLSMPTSPPARPSHR